MHVNISHKLEDSLMYISLNQTMALTYTHTFPYKKNILAVYT